MKKVLVTGSSGLIGSECVIHFDSMGNTVFGVDNNMRRDFFGERGDTTWNLERLKSQTGNFTHHELDIRDRAALEKLFAEIKFDVICHCAAQPSHDLAASRPFDDFDVNAVGTLNLLEMARRYCPEAFFLHMSTNKVYGDGPNFLPLTECETRYDYECKADFNGIPETFSLDQCTHSIFGASKVAGDVMVQEYGRYFDMKTACFRGGCLTGPKHSGVELHGFLSYLVRATVRAVPYTIYGYKGKQVRDQIHSADVVAAFEAYMENPKPASVYNLGGGRDNSASVLECIKMVEEASDKKLEWTLSDENRIGDHMCYISDLSRMRSELKGWDITRSLPSIVEEMVQSEIEAFEMS